MAGDLVFPDATINVTSTVTINNTATPEVMDLLGQILAEVQQVRTSESKQELDMSAMQDAMDRITKEVQESRTVEDGLVTLVQGLAQQIRDNANNPVALQALADSLDQGQTSMSDAITANTPADTSGGTGTTPPDTGTGTPPA